MAAECSLLQAHSEKFCDLFGCVVGQHVRMSHVEAIVRGGCTPFERNTGFSQVIRNENGQQILACPRRLLTIVVRIIFRTTKFVIVVPSLLQYVHGVGRLHPIVVNDKLRPPCWGELRGHVCIFRQRAIDAYKWSFPLSPALARLFASSSKMCRKSAAKSLMSPLVSCTASSG